MTELTLIASEGEPKKRTWIQERVGDFLIGFKEATGKNCPIPYVQLVGMLHNNANDPLNGWATISEQGEIVKGYPDMDVWAEQCKGFFEDEFAGRKTGFSFSYFLKGFGTFVKYEPKKKEQAKQVRRMIACTTCHKNHYLDQECV